MFDTKEAAEEVNSQCAFCGLEKFRLADNPQGQGYILERCGDETCEEHCKGGHDATITIAYLNNEDAVAIASGW